MDRFKTLITSKTFWGAVLVAVASLYKQEQVAGFLTSNDWFTAIGVVVTAAGVRDAITKVHQEVAKS